MKKASGVFTFLMAAFVLAGQQTGAIDYKELGLAFTIPQGWVGQESGEGFVMGSNTEPGLLLMLPHETNSIETLRQEAAAGIEDESIVLKPEGALKAIGSKGIGGLFVGTVQGEKAKAYLIGLINPHGQGLTIMAVTEAGKYTARYEQLALAVANSVRFSKPESAPAVQEWKKELMNKRLSYIYSSSSHTFGYSGMSETEEMWLCAQGYFQYKSNSSNSFDTGGAFGYSGGNEKGAGTWDVVPNNSGGAMIQLTFQNGTVKNFNIQGVKGQKLYLGGYGYFWANAGEKCN